MIEQLDSITLEERDQAAIARLARLVDHMKQNDATAVNDRAAAKSA